MLQRSVVTSCISSSLTLLGLIVSAALLSGCTGGGGGGFNSDLVDGSDASDDTVSDVSMDDRTAYQDFLDALPTALCEWYEGCGLLEGESIEDCAANIDAEIVADDLDCDAAVAFFVNNRAGIDACMSGETGACGTNDDLDAFCPSLAGFSEDICDVVVPPITGAGAACNTDADCSAGMRCLNSVLPGSVKYCAPTCEDATWEQDCGEFVNNSFGLNLEDKLGASYNHWNSDILWRVPSCSDLSDAPEAGTPDGNSYCIWVCPNNSAGVYSEDGSGAVEACSCMPNYEKTADEPFTCEWETAPEDHECSYFTPCTEANTDLALCSNKDFSCVVNERLEGSCLDLVSGDQIEECLLSCNYECDHDCLVQTCTNFDSSFCAERCCSSDQPECN